MTNEESGMDAPARPGLVERAMKLDWLGQALASMLWITSVFVYGIESTGDWLQLGAASAWFVANVAALVSNEGER